MFGATKCFCFEVKQGSLRRSRAAFILSDKLNNAYEYFLLLLREMAASGRATKINSRCRAMPYK